MYRGGRTVHREKFSALMSHRNSTDSSMLLAPLIAHMSYTTIVVLTGGAGGMVARSALASSRTPAPTMIAIVSGACCSPAGGRRSGGFAAPVSNLMYLVRGSGCRKRETSSSPEDTTCSRCSYTSSMASHTTVGAWLAALAFRAIPDSGYRHALVHIC